MPHGKFLWSFDELACACCSRQKSRRLLVPYCVRWQDVVRFMAYKKILATFCHLPEYPTCPNTMSWHCIRRTVELTWPVEPFLQYGSPPWGGPWFLRDWIGRLTRVRPFSSDKGLGEGSTIPKFCSGLPSTLHRIVLPYYVC